MIVLSYEAYAERVNTVTCDRQLHKIPSFLYLLLILNEETNNLHRILLTNPTNANRPVISAITGLLALRTGAWFVPPAVGSPSAVWSVADGSAGIVHPIRQIPDGFPDVRSEHRPHVDDALEAGQTRTQRYMRLPWGFLPAGDQALPTSLHQ